MSQEYEIGKEMLESLIEEYGVVKGTIKYYKMMLTGDIKLDGGE